MPGTGIAAATKLLIATFVPSTVNIGETIRRTVGHVHISSDQVAAIETPFVGFGMVVVSDAAAAIGTTAIPGPLTDAQDDGWFVYQTACVSQGIDSNVRGNTFHFDSRAMRRIEVGFSVAVMLETGVGFGSITQLSISMYATRA